MRRGCPDCPVTQLHSELEEEVVEQFEELRTRRNLPASHTWRYSFKRLKADVDTISSKDSAQGGEGASAQWTVRDRALVAQLRNLRAAHRRQQLKKPPKEATT